MREIETDYLVVGAGAAGMAFTDALIAASDADVVIVDRRHGPGGHWNDAYPFVRLHGPSTCRCAGTGECPAYDDLAISEATEIASQCWPKRWAGLHRPRSLRPASQLPEECT